MADISLVVDERGDESASVWREYHTARLATWSVLAMDAARGIQHVPCLVGLGDRRILNAAGTAGPGPADNARKNPPHWEDWITKLPVSAQVFVLRFAGRLRFVGEVQATDTSGVRRVVLGCVRVAAEVQALWAAFEVDKDLDNWAYSGYTRAVLNGRGNVDDFRGLCNLAALDALEKWYPGRGEGTYKAQWSRYLSQVVTWGRLNYHGKHPFLEPLPGSADHAGTLMSAGTGDYLWNDRKRQSPQANIGLPACGGIVVGDVYGMRKTRRAKVR
jgi:hypothetical protein